MTLRQFRREHCGSVSALIDFAYSHELYDAIDERICSDEYKNEQVNEWLSETNESWESVRDTLNNIPEGFDYYWVNGWVDYEGIYDGSRSDIDEVREIIEDAMYGEWDEDDDGDEDEEFLRNSYEDFLFDDDEDQTDGIEEFQFEEVFADCKNKLRSIDGEQSEESIASLQ